MSDEGDKYEHFNYDHDKHMYSGHSGKQRTKKEAEQHTNQHDVGGRWTYDSTAMMVTLASFVGAKKIFSLSS